MLKNPRPCIYAHTLCSYVHFNVGDLCESQKSVIWSSRWIFEGTIKMYSCSTYVITISSFNILLRIHCHSSLLFALRKMFNVWVFFKYIFWYFCWYITIWVHIISCRKCDFLLDHDIPFLAYSVWLTKEAYSNRMLFS